MTFTKYDVIAMRVELTATREHVHKPSLVRKIAASHTCFFFFSLMADGPHSILPVVTKNLRISPRFTPYDFFITMQVQRPYNSPTNSCILLTHVFRYGGFNTNNGHKNQTHDFRISRCVDYLLDHSGTSPNEPSPAARETCSLEKNQWFR